MATTVFGTTLSTPSWDVPSSQESDSMQDIVSFYYAFPVGGGVVARYQQKCVDGVSGQWVFWETTFIDRLGSQYPGSSFDSSTYKIQTIVYDRA